MTTAMKNLVESEKWRRAGVTTFYRKSLVLASVCEPGISVEELASIIGTTRGCITTAVTQLCSLNLMRKEMHFKTEFKGPRKKMKIFPTPYAKDLASIVETV